MARDYAKKPDRNSAQKSKRAVSSTGKRSSTRKADKPKSQPARKSVAKAQHGGLSLKWILSLAAVGGFVGFIAYLNSLPAPDQARHSSPADSQDKTDTTTSSEQPTDKKPGFKFYDMLPDSEVVPPKVDEYTPGPGQTDFDYLVQTGSFKTEKDAERQRAQIAFQGLRAFVSQIDLDSGSTWYRVNVGPFTSRSQMNSAVDKLVSINIEPLVRKVPKESSKDS